MVGAISLHTNYPVQFKIKMVELSYKPDISVAQLAREHGINDNLLFKWRQFWREGNYGTLIVNLDTHRPLVLLPGRDPRTLAAWFRKYPEIQVVSRDRGGIYATTAREGAPQARQVADR
ncbi:hypothetical protein CRN84_02230 [Budvicia aquatica]|uniref:Uncharacterized protein n=1 Tax=Budvicia aquatica TaxID=82979 RepID=A0A2C6BVR6_9GAMM|nr:hypothetical protein CRN84_02230 [Budvicia aquatica]